jgi:predicted acyltransferase (DUF342 family)
MDLTTAQTAAGIKTFSSAPVMSGASITSSTIPIASVVGTAMDLTTAQTAAGVKTFSSAPVMSGASITSSTIPIASVVGTAMDLTTAQTASGLKTFTSGLVTTAGAVFNNDVSMSARLYVAGDSSHNGRLFVGADTSLNGRLYVGGDVSMAGNLTVTNKFYLGPNAISVAGSTLAINGTSITSGGGGSSSNFTTDVSMNNRLYVLGDTSLNGRLFVALDVSMNGNVAVGGNLSINGNLLINQNAATAGSYTTSIQQYGGGVAIGKATPVTGLALDVSGGVAVSQYIGIGTTAPQFPLHVTSAVTSTTSVNSSLVAVSIYGVNSVVTNGGFYSATGTWIASDERIKTNIKSVDNSNAIELLQKIAPRQFTYVDTNTHGSKTVYGFIAQEVAKIIPTAVTMRNSYIPNIYEPATISNGNTLTLNSKSTSLFITDNSSNRIRIKLFDSNNNESFNTIVQIIDDKTFQIAETLDEETTFVYGQEINDFNSLQTDAIFTITVAAVQDMYRELQETKQQLLSNKQQFQTQLDAIIKRLDAANI